MINSAKKRFAMPHLYQPVDDSLVLWLKSSASSRNSNQITDLSKSKNHANNIGASWDSDPLNNPCLKFDGVNDYLSIPNSSSIHIVRNYTWLFWLNMDTLSPAEVLISDRLDPNPFCYQIYTTIDTGAMRLFSKTTAGAVLEVASSVNAKIKAGQWGFYSITRTASNVVFSQDNLFEVIPIGNDVGEANTQPVVFGVTYSSGTDNWWPGKLGELRLYNRPLSMSEISQIYESTKHLYGRS